MRYFVLQGQTPVEVASLADWSDWWERVGQRRRLVDVVGGLTVTTQFRGLIADEEETPRCFETTVTTARGPFLQHHSRTYHDALTEHARLLGLVRAAKGGELPCS